jgi:hypothetical protein
LDLISIGELAANVYRYFELAVEFARELKSDSSKVGSIPPPFQVVTRVILPGP